MCVCLSLIYSTTQLRYHLLLIFWVIPSFSHLRVHVLQRSDLERQVVLLIVKLCELTMDVLGVRQLAVEAHNAASYDVHENFDAIATQHHRKRIEELKCEGSHRRRIARRMSLWENLPNLF
jgi:hypothetical protein